MATATAQPPAISAHMSGPHTPVIPTPISPSGTITTLNPAFTWTKLTGAGYYQFQVFRGSALVYTIAFPAASCGTTANCTNTPPTALSYGTYAWKVHAYVGGAWQAFSAVKAFTVVH
jgi:hypothetical protein